MSSDVGGELHQHQPASGVCKECVKGACLGVFGGYGYDCVVFEGVFGVYGMQCYVWIGIPVD